MLYLVATLYNILDTISSIPLYGLITGKMVKFTPYTEANGKVFGRLMLCRIIYKEKNKLNNDFSLKIEEK